MSSGSKARSQTGAEGIGWHRYVITQGKNTITGHRQGSLEGVTVAVGEILVQLKARRKLKQGRVQFIPRGGSKTVRV